MNLPHLPRWPLSLPAARRPLLWAIVVSLLLHALLFAPDGSHLALPGAASVGDSRMNARLRAAAAPAIETPAAAAPAETPADEAPAAREPLERSYEAAPPAPEPTATEAPGAAAPTAGQQGVDVAGLREYHLALGGSARQFRRYPEEARAAGWQGRVAIRLEVAAGGRPTGLHVIASSGYPVLDQAALEMLALAARHTAVPESLRGRDFSIDLAMDFNPADLPATEQPAAPTAAKP